MSRHTRKYRSSVFPALPTPFRTSRSTSASSTRTLERHTCIRVLNLKRRKLAAAAVALHRSLTTEDDICSKRVTTFAPPTRVGTPAPAYQTNLVPISDTRSPIVSETARCLLFPVRPGAVVVILAGRALLRAPVIEYRAQHGDAVFGESLARAHGAFARRDASPDYEHHAV